jgi:hypothetical protein
LGIVAVVTAFVIGGLAGLAALAMGVVVGLASVGAWWARSRSGSRPDGSIRRASLFSENYAYRVAEHEVEFEVWVGSLHLWRVILITGAVMHLALLFGLAMDLESAILANEKSLFDGLGDVGSALLFGGIAAAFGLGAALASSRHVLRLESRGPLHLTTRRLLGPTRRRELPRTTPLALRVQDGTWQVGVKPPSGLVEVYLSGPGLPPEHVTEDVATITAALERLAAAPAT